MFKLFRRKEKKTFFSRNLGVFYLNKERDVLSWDCSLLPGSILKNVEISIETQSEDIPTDDTIMKIVTFLTSYQPLEKSLLDHIQIVYAKSEHPIADGEVKRMYRLASVTLKENDDWWVVLEPHDVGSAYNHFMRFTIRNEKIVWASVN